MSELIYLDNAATTFPKPPEVHKFMSDFYREYGVNPGRAGYDLAIEAEATVRETRTRLCKFFGGDDPERLVFTYNATDALNQVIQGVIVAKDKPQHVITTILEHNSVLRPLYHLEQLGRIQVTYLSIDNRGFISPDELRAAIRPDTTLVIVNHGSNVIGTVQPVAEIGQICYDKGIFFAIDASQTAGVVPINMREMHISAACFTGHKSLFGPTGIGGICVADGAEIMPTRWGGTGVKSIQKSHLEEYPYRLEAGTLNLMGIAGLLAGQRFIESRGGVEGIYAHEMGLMRKLWEGIRHIDGVITYCAESLDNHLPVLSVNVAGLEAADTGVMLDVDYDIATRTGFHCAPLVHTHLGTAEIKGTARFAVGPYNTEAHIDTAIRAMGEIAEIGRKRRKV